MIDSEVKEHVLALGSLALGAPCVFVPTLKHFSLHVELLLLCAATSARPGTRDAKFVL